MRFSAPGMKRKVRFIQAERKGGFVEVSNVVCKSQALKTHTFPYLLDMNFLDFPRILLMCGQISPWQSFTLDLKLENVEVTERHMNVVVI